MNFQSDSELVRNVTAFLAWVCRAYPEVILWASGLCVVVMLAYWALGKEGE